MIKGTNNMIRRFANIDMFKEYIDKFIMKISFDNDYYCYDEDKYYNIFEKFSPKDKAYIVDNLFSEMHRQQLENDFYTDMEQFKDNNDKELIKSIMNDIESDYNGSIPAYYAIDVNNFVMELIGALTSANDGNLYMQIDIDALYKFVQSVYDNEHKDGEDVIHVIMREEYSGHDEGDNVYYDHILVGVYDLIEDANKIVDDYYYGLNDGDKEFALFCGRNCYVITINKNEAYGIANLN